MTAEEIAEMTDWPLKKVLRLIEATEPPPVHVPTSAELRATEERRLQRSPSRERERQRRDHLAPAHDGERRRTAEEIHALAFTLHRDGVGLREIGARVGRSHTTVRRWLLEAELHDEPQIPGVE